MMKKLKNTFIYFIIRGAAAILPLLPRGLLSRLGAVLGAFAFYAARGEREKTLRHLEAAYGVDLTDGRRRELALYVFVNLGRNALETFGWARRGPAAAAALVSRVEGWHRFEEAYARGRGVLAVTAHLGNWELLAAYFASRVPTAVVAKRTYDPRLDRLLTAFRESYGVKVIHRGNVRGLLRALKERRLIGFLIDQDTGSNGVFVPFFDREAWTQAGPAMLARRTEAPLLPIFIARGKDGRFTVRVEPEIPVARTADPGKDVREAVWRYTRAVEGAVRAHPDQWVWMHERWKTRPPG